MSALNSKQLEFATNLEKSIFTLFTQVSRGLFQQLRQNIQSRKLHVMFEPELCCDPRTDHLLPKDVLPVFDPMVARAEAQMGCAVKLMLASTVKEHAATLALGDSANVQYYVDEMNYLYIQLAAAQRVIQKQTKLFSEEKAKLRGQINQLKEQLYVQQMGNSLYCPDNMKEFFQEAKKNPKLQAKVNEAITARRSQDHEALLKAQLILEKQQKDIENSMQNSLPTQLEQQVEQISGLGHDVADYEQKIAKISEDYEKQMKQIINREAALQKELEETMHQISLMNVQIAQQAEKLKQSEKQSKEFEANSKQLAKLQQQLDVFNSSDGKISIEKKELEQKRKMISDQQQFQKDDAKADFELSVGTKQLQQKDSQKSGPDLQPVVNQLNDENNQLKRQIKQLQQQVKMQLQNSSQDLLQNVREALVDSDKVDDTKIKAKVSAKTKDDEIESGASSALSKRSIKKSKLANDSKQSIKHIASDDANQYLDIISSLKQKIKQLETQIQLQNEMDTSQQDQVLSNEVMKKAAGFSVPSNAITASGQQLSEMSSEEVFSLLQQQNNDLYKQNKKLTEELNNTLIQQKLEPSLCQKCQKLSIGNTDDINGERLSTIQNASQTSSLPQNQQLFGNNAVQNQSNINDKDDLQLHNHIKPQSDVINESNQLQSQEQIKQQKFYQDSKQSEHTLTNHDDDSHVKNNIYKQNTSDNSIKMTEMLSDFNQINSLKEKIVLITGVLHISPPLFQNSSISEFDEHLHQCLQLLFYHSQKENGNQFIKDQDGKYHSSLVSGNTNGVYQHSPQSQSQTGTLQQQISDQNPSLQNGQIQENQQNGSNIHGNQALGGYYSQNISQNGIQQQQGYQKELINNQQQADSIIKNAQQLEFLTAQNQFSYDLQTMGELTNVARKATDVRNFGVQVCPGVQNDGFVEELDGQDLEQRQNSIIASQMRLKPQGPLQNNFSKLYREVAGGNVFERLFNMSKIVQQRQKQRAKEMREMGGQISYLIEELSSSLIFGTDFLYEIGLDLPERLNDGFQSRHLNNQNLVHRIGETKGIKSSGYINDLPLVAFDQPQIVQPKQKANNSPTLLSSSQLKYSGYTNKQINQNVADSVSVIIMNTDGFSLPDVRKSVAPLKQKTSVVGYRKSVSRLSENPFMDVKKI